MNIILLLLLSGLAPFLAATDVFCDNLKALAATLPNTTSSSPVHFATAVVGQAPDIVYMLALCPGDVLNSSDCAECITDWFDKVLNATPLEPQCSRSGSYYYDCTLVYSNDNILEAPPNTTGTYSDWNIRTDARLIAGAIIQELLVKTVLEAASMTPWRFATAVMDRGTTSPMVFSMAQCTPDLSSSDCLTCLSHLLGKMTFTMSLRMGGRMGAIRCYFRYEAYIFYQGKPMLYLGAPNVPSPASPETRHTGRMSKLWAIPIGVLPLAAAAFLSFMCYSRQLTRQRKGKVNKSQGSRRPQILGGEEQIVWQGKSSEFLVFGFEKLLVVTNNFSEENKLGQGGFGSVYKGHLPGGMEIAVKRLASHSGQGFIEFENEVQLLAKFQHRNLVRLLGCCSQEEEKILVYEYLPNKSLDFFIFDENKRSLLDWSKRVAIIEGVAHGLLYLHKHSRLLVIHRDLKPRNILLDGEMNPKISDFGLAKILNSNNTEGNNTRRVVGTYGYMAPEYASQGIFSIKTDVFSFGVLVLEILSGKKNTLHQCGAFINLLGYAWQLSEEGRWMEIIDAQFLHRADSSEMMRCINIALLCVQENAADRPTMLDVVAMLSSKSMILRGPKHPAYFTLSVGKEVASIATQPCSANDVTISIVTAR